MGAAARAEGDATPGGELAQLVESLAGDGDATAAAALRFSKDDKARRPLHEPVYLESDLTLL